MLSYILPALLPALAYAAPAAVQQRDAAPSPTLFTFTYLGSPVTATWFGTATVKDASCPTQTFTYQGAAITVPYNGPGTPQSCLAAAPCPTQTFTYLGSAITIPYTGPGTPQSCLTGGAGDSAPAPTKVPEVPAATSEGFVTIQTSVPASSAGGPGQGGPSVATSELQTPTTTATPVASSPAASASGTVPKGFNYGSQGMTRESFESQFNIARNLAGVTRSQFTSARLYTMIQDGTTNSVIDAIPAAIATRTTLLLGLFYPNIDNELAALSAAVQQYGTAFTDLVVGISVGSEDLYRNSPTGIASGSNPGANPDDIIAFIAATRNVIANTPLAGKLVGHVDTWTAYVNGSNAGLIAACDFLGVDAYPYFQNTQANGIENGAALFQEAYQATVAVAGGKPVWITETGWPVAGATFGQAVPNAANAKTFWDQVGCGFAFDNIPTWWYNLVDGTATPNFGVTAGSTTPYFDLACPAA